MDAILFLKQEREEAFKLLRYLDDAIIRAQDKTYLEDGGSSDGYIGQIQKDGKVKVSGKRVKKGSTEEHIKAALWEKYPAQLALKELRSLIKRKTNIDLSRRSVQQSLGKLVKKNQVNRPSRGKYCAYDFGPNGHKLI